MKSTELDKEIQEGLYDPQQPTLLKIAQSAYKQAKNKGKKQRAAHTAAMQAVQKHTGKVEGSWDIATKAQDMIEGLYDPKAATRQITAKEWSAKKKHGYTLIKGGQKYILRLDKGKTVLEPVKVFDPKTKGKGTMTQEFKEREEAMLRIWNELNSPKYQKIAKQLKKERAKGYDPKQQSHVYKVGWKAKTGFKVKSFWTKAEMDQQIAILKKAGIWYRAWQAGTDKVYDPKMSAETFIAGKELLGMTAIDKKGMRFRGVRFGSEFGDSSRKGTWYVIPAYEGEVSSYESGKWYSRGIGVGGKEKYEKDIILTNPYFFNWSKLGEGKAVIELAKEVLGNEITVRLMKGIRGSRAEKAFSKLESAIASKLSLQGYDGVIFYDYFEHGKRVHPKQAFVFFKNVSRKIQEIKPGLYDPAPLTSVPNRWYEAMVKGIKKSSDVGNPYAIVKSIWAKLSLAKKAEIKAREKKGEHFKYDLPLPVDKPTKGTGTVRMVKPFKLAEVQVNLSVKDYLAARASGLFQRMKRGDGTTALVARCKSNRPKERNVNMFIDKVK